MAQRVGRGIALLFHDRGTRRGWVVSRTPRPQSTPGKHPVPILQEAGWAPGLVWTGGKSRPHRFRSRTVQPGSSVAIPTVLPGWASIQYHKLIQSHLCVISSFPSEVSETCLLLGYYAASSGKFLLTLRYNLSVLSWRIKNPKEKLLFQYGVIRKGLSRNVGKKLPLLSAQWPRRAQLPAVIASRVTLWTVELRYKYVTSRYLTAVCLL